jgi:hypothetical protein
MEVECSAPSKRRYADRAPQKPRPPPAPSPRPSAGAPQEEAGPLRKRQHKQRAGHRQQPPRAKRRHAGANGGADAATDAGTCSPDATDAAVPKRKRNRRSRSKKATAEAAQLAAEVAKAVKVGDAPMPKRNQLADIDVKKLGLKKIGPFWYSRRLKSPCYVTFLQFQILKRIAPFFEDEAHLVQFKVRRSKEASGVSLRVVDNFYTNWCKTHCIITAEEEGFLLDVKDDYDAMLAKYNKPNFDAFCRGKHCVLFETPAAGQYLDVVVPKPVRKPKKRGRKPKCTCDEFNGHGQGDFILECDVPDPEPVKDNAVALGLAAAQAQAQARAEDLDPDSDVRRVNGTTVAQVHFFNWLLQNEHYKLICRRAAAIHRTMKGSIQRNRQLKRVRGHGKRQELSHEMQVSHVIERSTELRF